MDFTLPADLESLRERVRAFVVDRIIPLEADPANYDKHENICESALAQVRSEVKAAGLWAPQVAKEYRGMGLP
jgi:acyl-CoA dehydrogenase